MSLKPSKYFDDHTSRCAICGKEVFGRRLGIAKCHDCANKILKDVVQDFEDNYDLYLMQAMGAVGGPVTEAIMNTKRAHLQLMDMTIEMNVKDLIEVFDKVDIDAYKK